MARLGFMGVEVNEMWCHERDDPLQLLSARVRDRDDDGGGAMLPAENIVGDGDHRVDPESIAWEPTDKQLLGAVIDAMRTFRK